jgi:hypothetical protein
MHNHPAVVAAITADRLRAAEAARRARTGVNEEPQAARRVPRRPLVARLLAFAAMR